MNKYLVVFSLVFSVHVSSFADDGSDVTNRVPDSVFAIFAHQKDSQLPRQVTILPGHSFNASEYPPGVNYISSVDVFGSRSYMVRAYRDQRPGQVFKLDGRPPLWSYVSSFTKTNATLCFGGRSAYTKGIGIKKDVNEVFNVEFETPLGDFYSGMLCTNVKSVAFCNPGDSGFSIDYVSGEKSFNPAVGLVDDVTGAFRVLDFSRDKDGNVSRFAADFTLIRNRQMFVSGAIRFRSGVPIFIGH